MTEREGMLIVFSGPSGVGKDTVLRMLLERRDDCVVSVSATTRAPRPGEVDGVDYHFITKEQFGGFIACGDMLEYTQYGEDYYGTPKSGVDLSLSQGKNVILEIEVQGALQIKKLREKAVLVFVLPPAFSMLQERLHGRGTESAECIERRLAAARQELACADRYDYVIVNDSVEACCESLSAIITAQGFSARNMSGVIEEVCLDA